MGRTVLVVDDSPSMRKMVAYTLDKSGFSVVEAENGKEALAQLDALRLLRTVAKVLP